MCDKLKGITSICQKCKRVENGEQMGTERKTCGTAKNEKHLACNIRSQNKELFNGCVQEARMDG